MHQSVSRAAARVAVEVLESRRLLAAGDLDPTFDGDGRVLLNSGLGGGFTDVAVQSDGKVLAVGQLSPSGGGTYAIFRYNAKGTPDTTFGGGGGAAILPWNVSNDQFEIAVLPNNAVVVAGASD